MLKNEMPVNAVTVVDDEPWALDVLIRLVRQWEYPCQAATTAEEAIELFQLKQTPILVTDIRMPGRGGVWLIKEVRQRWPEVSIIVITAGHEQDLVNKCLDAGAQHYFLKPINFDEFRHALETAYRNFQMHQENYLYHNYLEQTIYQKTRRIRDTYLSAINSLVRLLEARDPYTSGHSLRVSKYALGLAKQIGLPRKQRRQIRLAAKLHDIGKVGIPEMILNKVGPLSEAERALVEKHPVIGERILSPIIRNRHVLAGIRNHHERYDSFGYPDGLRGLQIPEIARVITVADCFDALTSSRSYRKALSVAESIAILEEGSGNKFDPRFVPLFVDLVRSGGFPKVLDRR